MYFFFIGCRIGLKSLRRIPAYKKVNCHRLSEYQQHNYLQYVPDYQHVIKHLFDHWAITLVG